MRLFDRLFRARGPRCAECGTVMETQTAEACLPCRTREEAAERRRRLIARVALP